MDGPIEIFLDSGTSHFWPSLGKNYPFYPLIFPKNKAPKVKRGWFWCIIVTGISSGVREIEIWRYLDFRSNFPLLFFVCILSNFRAISTPQTRLYWPSVALFTWSRFFLVILILSFRRPSLPKPKPGLFFKTKLSESETFFPRPNSLKPKPRLFS